MEGLHELGKLNSKNQELELFYVEKIEAKKYKLEFTDRSW